MVPCIVLTLLIGLDKTSGITVVMATARRCHFSSFVIYSSGDKFEEHCFDICRDIFD